MIEKLKDSGIEDYPFEDEEGCHYSSKIEYLYTKYLDFCGCGNPEEIVVYVKEMLEKIDKGIFGDYEDHSYMFFCYWADHKGFIEHGISVRVGWLTPLGAELLNDINLILKENND